MNELFRAIVTDLCTALTAVLMMPRETTDEPEAIAAAKKALAAAQDAQKVAGYYSR